MATFTVMLFIRVLVLLPQLLLRLFLFYLYGDCSLQEELPLYLCVIDPSTIPVPEAIPEAVPVPVANATGVRELLQQIIVTGMLNGINTLGEALKESPEMTAEHCKHCPQCAKLPPEEVENIRKNTILITGTCVLLLSILAIYLSK